MQILQDLRECGISHGNSHTPNTSARRKNMPTYIAKPSKGCGGQGIKLI